MATPSTIATSIRRSGFRKWYERELIRSHLHLVLLILCTLGVLGALEALSGGSGRDRLLLAACLLLAAVIGVWALRRYVFFLMRAETIANQAVCPGCAVYARWIIENEAAATAEHPASLTVSCRACSHHWRIDC